MNWGAPEKKNKTITKREKERKGKRVRTLDKNKMDEE